MSAFSPIARKLLRPIDYNLLARRQISFKRIFASIWGTTTDKEKLAHNEPRAQLKMSTMDELRAEKQQLEDKVRDLVSKLEALKRPDEIKLTPDQVIRSKEELEAIAAMEKLELKAKAEVTSKVAPDAEKKPTATSAAAAAKKGEPKAAKGRGTQTTAKEPEKPLDVSRLDLRIGKIVEVDKHPDADALYLEKIDCGEPAGPRTVISGLVNHVPIEQMRDRLVVVLCNLKPAKMRGILSEAMVMCASTPEKVELLGVPDGVKPGDRVVFEKYPGEPDEQLNPKKKIWEQVAPDIKTNDEGVAMYKDCPFRVASVDGAFKSSLRNVQIR